MFYHQIRLYEVLDEYRLYSPDGVRLLDQRRISAHRHGWEVFRVTRTVQQWVNDSTTNHGEIATRETHRLVLCIAQYLLLVVALVITETFTQTKGLVQSKHETQPGTYPCYSMSVQRMLYIPIRLCYLTVS